MEDTELTDRLALSPRYALYRSIDRFFQLRAMGHGGSEALHAVLTCIDSIRDGNYDEDMTTIRDGPSSEWDVMRAVLRLLKRKNLWLSPPQALRSGEELLAAIE